MDGETYTRTLMPEVGVSIDETGAALEPAGPKLLFMKVAAAGMSLFAEFIFAKWQQYKRQEQLEQQRERQQTQNQQNNNVEMLAIQGTPSAGDTPQQAFD